MNERITLLRKISLRLFDGEGGAAAAPSGTPGESQVNPAVAGQGNAGEKPIIMYGKQAEAVEPVQQAADAGQPKQDTPEDRRKKFDELINGEYKDEFTERTQKIIDRRFSHTKTVEAENAQYKEIADILKTKYRLADDADIGAIKSAVEGDEDTWADAADEAGMSVEQFRQFRKYKQDSAALDAIRENDIAAQRNREKAERWYGEAQELKKKFPGFDLRTELQDRNFMAAINAGVPMEMAYKGKYYDQFMGEATQTAAKNAEQAVVNNVRARGTRPAENGASSQSPAIIKSDPSKLTLADFDDIAKRVARGERIVF